MAHKYPIVQFNAPTSFIIAGDQTDVFKSASSGVATSFEVFDTIGLNGKFAVFASAYDAFNDQTTVMISGTTLAGSPGIGYITNSSVYKLTTPEEDEIIIVDAKEFDTTTSLEFVGRSSAGWGETIQQNILNLLCNFSSPTPPNNPVNGQLWFDENSDTLKIWVGTWQILNQSPSNASQIGSYTFVQSVPNDTWNIVHNLNSTNLVYNVYVDIAGTLTPIMPSSATFINDDTLRITFSSPRTGKIAIIRAAN